MAGVREQELGEVDFLDRFAIDHPGPLKFFPQSPFGRRSHRRRGCTFPDVSLVQELHETFIPFFADRDPLDARDCPCRPFFNHRLGCDRRQIETFYGTLENLGVGHFKSEPVRDQGV